jgi:fructose-1-phosphate kinase PfkB-like protein
MIVVPGFNAAWDVIVQAPSWLPGTVERAERQQVMAGGNPAELRLVTTTTRSRTDICLTTGAGVTTVVNGPPPPVSSADVDAALELLEASIETGDVVVLAGRQLSGSIPRLLALIARRGGQLVVDASGPDLAECLDASPPIAKVNAPELAALSPGATSADALVIGRSLAPQPTALIVTDGERGLRAWLADGPVVDVRPPRVQEMNGFGAGDAMTAGIVAALDEGRPLVDGLVKGTAWAAATVERLGPEFDSDRARALESAVVVDWIAAPSAGVISLD